MTKTIVNSIDYGAWKARFDEASAQIQARARGVWQGLERDPARLRQLQNGLIVLLVLWSLSSVAQLVWIPFRAGAIETAPALALNPPASIARGESEIIDTSSVLGSRLFGSAPDGAVDAFDSVGTSPDRDGIERNANETRLALILTGIAASTDDGRGSAVIKSGAAEQVFSIGDALPASGQVLLAKVMPQQVVIDNNGTYELLKLYDRPGITVPARVVTRPASASSASPAESMPAPEAMKASADERSVLAGQYRRQLYDNPESLARVVSVSPVREDDRIVGYRIAPGTDRAAFDAFGLRHGDIVTAVNGLALSDATNTVKLYQLMKDATEATFDIDRDGGTVTVSIDLASP